jgi:hypothetical protein
MRIAFLFLLVFGAMYAVFDFRGKPAAPMNLAQGPRVDHWAEEKRAARTMQVQELPPPVTTPTASPVDHSPVDHSPVDHSMDDVETPEQFWAAIQEQIRQRHGQFTSQMDALNLDRLFDANILIDPDTYPQAYRDLRAARTLIDSYEQESDRAFKEIPKRLEATRLPDELRQAMQREINDAPAIRERFFTRAMSLERQRSDGLMGLLKFVEPQLAQMHVSDGALVCDSPEKDARLLAYLRALAENRQARRKLQAEAKADQNP